MLKHQLDIKQVKAYLLKKHEQKLIEKEKERTEIIAKLTGLTQIWQKYEIDRVYLHGSSTDLTFNKYSDIDIAIEPDIDFEALLKLYCEINRHFEREVDIRLLNEIPFKDKIKNRGILIYERKNRSSNK